MYAGRLKGYSAIGYRIGGADAENEPDTSLSPKKGADAHTLARIAGQSSIVITMRYVPPASRRNWTGLCDGSRKSSPETTTEIGRWEKAGWGRGRHRIGNNRRTWGKSCVGSRV